MWHLTACKISVSLSFLNWIKNEMIFYHISELMLATLIQRYDKVISFQEWETNWNFTGCQVPHFMVVLIPKINLLNLSWIIKYLLLRNMEPLTVLEWFSKGLRDCLCRISKFLCGPTDIMAGVPDTESRDWRFLLQWGIFTPLVPKTIFNLPFTLSHANLNITLNIGWIT